MLRSSSFCSNTAWIFRRVSCCAGAKEIPRKLSRPYRNTICAFALKQRLYEAHQLRVHPGDRLAVALGQARVLSHHLAVAIDNVALGNLIRAVAIAQILLRISRRRV